MYHNLSSYCSNHASVNDQLVSTRRPSSKQVATTPEASDTYPSYYLFRKVESKKKAIERLEEQLQKLEVQATDKVNTWGREAY